MAKSKFLLFIRRIDLCYIFTVCLFCLLFCLKGQGSIFPSYPIRPSPVEIWCKFRHELQKSQLHDQKSMRNHSSRNSSTLRYAEIEASLQNKNHSEWAEITATGSKLDANYEIFQALRSMQKSMRLAKITAGEQKSKRRGQNSTRNRSRMKHEQIDRRPGYDASRFDIPIAVFA